jgi:uncharacterized membrane protein
VCNPIVARQKQRRQGRKSGLDPRQPGLALFLVCIGKLFFYDLRQLETLYRILSFFVLGVILVSVSWLYTRFRYRIQRYL